MSVAVGCDGDELRMGAGDETLVHAGNSGLMTRAAVGEVDVAWTYDAWPEEHPLRGHDGNVQAGPETFESR